jgi:hypothetical protein
MHRTRLVGRGWTSAAILLLAFPGCSLPTSVIGTADIGTRDGGMPGFDVGIDAPMIDVGPMPDTGADAGHDAGSDVGMDAPLTPDTGADVGPDAWVPACTGTMTRCGTSTTLDTCNAGSWVTTTCGLGCLMGGAPHCATFDLLNVAGMSTPGTVDVTVSTDTSIATDPCNMAIGGVMPHLVAQSGGGTMVCLYDFRSLTVASGGALHVTGAYPLAIVAQENVDVMGLIDVSSYTTGGVRIGSGAGTGGDPGGSGTAGSGGSNTDGGGGGGAFGGNGGNGANEGSSSGGGGGGMAVASTLTPLIGGASGGAGSGSSAGAGGAGGGAIQISAYGTIRITGTVAAAGAGGAGGGTVSGGGGGGSGGGILLQAPTVTLGSSATSPSLTVAGGGGGAGGCGVVAASAGTDGFAAALGTASGAATGCLAHDGGAGGGGGTANGANSTNGGGSPNGSGGGGSIGRIVIMTSSGAVPAGPINPSTGVAHPMLMIH